MSGEIWVAMVSKPSMTKVWQAESPPFCYGRLYMVLTPRIWPHLTLVTAHTGSVQQINKIKTNAFTKSCVEFIMCVYITVWMTEWLPCMNEWTKLALQCVRGQLVGDSFRNLWFIQCKSIESGNI
jgi:hypothetical protein